VAHNGVASAWSLWLGDPVTTEHALLVAGLPRRSLLALALLVVSNMGRLVRLLAPRALRVLTLGLFCITGRLSRLVPVEVAAVAALVFALWVLEFAERFLDHEHRRTVHCCWEKISKKVTK
jgi:hypothetical protein